MRLSPRLVKIASLVPEGVVVADVGTDHGLLPAYLVGTGKCPRAIATDARARPLEAARQTLREFGVERQVELRLGYGLTVLKPREAGAVVMAGMGAHTVIAILERSPAVRATVGRFVLQPAKGTALVRRWLLQHDFRLAAEELVREGQRFHEVLAAEPGREEVRHPLLLALGLEVGPRLWEGRHPLLPAFLRDRLARYRRILQRMADSGLAHDPAALRFREKAECLEGLLAELGASRAGG